MWTKVAKAVGIVCLILGIIGSIKLAADDGGLLFFAIGVFITIASVSGIMVLAEISEKLENCQNYLSKISLPQTGAGSSNSSSPPLRSANTKLNLSDISGNGGGLGKWTCKKCGEPNSNGSRVCKGCGESR